ncbi:MAG: DUF1566 domain-containing protein, partial [Deltaproteobacteria bacterium]|nr:DUF1566 domain-containing protein [Deltaproteobacteria bacterium]
LCASAGHVCAVGKKCKVHADCNSGNCDFGSCQPQKCDNGVRDWWESDVDCGGEYCGQCGDGKKCQQDKDCANSHVCRAQQSEASPGFNVGACVPASCDLDLWWNTNDWGKKATMTDVMCGGPCARVMTELPADGCHFGKNDLLSDKTCGLDTVKCAKGKQCEQDGDCKSNACYEGQCVEMANSDGKQQPWETDVDCGGKNPYKCKLDKGCKKSSDCEYNAPCTSALAGDSKVCSLCDKNGLLDGWEADVDCGAQCASGKGSFELCKLGQKCGSSADCATGYQTTFQGQQITVDGVACNGGKCALSCFNGQWDEKTEADLDCGGKCKAKCGKDKLCKVGGDCESGGCLAGKCAGKCQNSLKDEGEGGIDCGGTCSTLCLKGMTCSEDANCTTGQCIKGVCGIDTCKDKQLSPGETDIDCGGPTCSQKCALDSSCKADKDCSTGWCDGQKCVATSCTDKKQSGGESDIDCGGPCKDTAACALGKKCKAGGDCAEKLCSAVGFCVDSTCKDLIMSSSETDVDCGGPCNAKCTTGKGCKSGADCDSKYCDGKVCVGDFCSDKVLSQGEADLDCGGPCAKKCSTGQKCSNNGDCQSSQCSTAGVCVNSACDDGKLSKGETDIDCGGVCGTPCLLGKTCLGGGDCATAVCATVSLACVATPCLDEMKDGDETDIDCGGVCTAKCAQNKGCKVDGDCKSGFCDGTQCVATACETKKQDGDETGIDCGGSCSKTCEVGAGCKADKDCASGYCDAKGLKCVASPCQDNHIDPGEADVDCGGICQASKTCALAQACKEGGDCGSGICSVGGLCVATTCDDGKLTSDETGIDCGGACAQKCTAGQGCKANSDCDAGFCSAKNLCVGGACEDGKLSKDETDIDCGGPCSAKCETGKGCLAEADCATGFCSATGGKAGTCQATACTDNKKNGGETDSDCGGPCTAKCAIDKTCAGDGDCQSGACAVNSKKCVASACLNEKVDTGETDVDCGGTCSQKCAATKGCKQNGDCQTTYCDGKACVSDPCVDKQKDGDETDVDCGGSCQVKCELGKGCGLPGDCSSTFCDGSACVATSCADKKADFGETDVDCGKVCSEKCAKDKGCQVGGDCASGICAYVSQVCVVDLCKDETLTTGGQSEADVDCGGPCSQKCVVGKQCKANGDCASGYCDGQVCVSDHCSDKQKDAGETGKDCGGTCETACDNGQGCGLSKDCTSTYCAAVTLACVATPCADEVKNGAETDVDCGGSVCSGKCAVGKVCKAGGDCKSGFCNTSTGKCVATSCEDGVQSGDEVGQDCGGSCSGLCKDGSTCSKDGDCQAGVCVSHNNGSGPFKCGCPPFTVAQKITSSKKSVVCAQNYVYPTGCSESGVGNMLACQPYQMTKNPVGPNDGYTYDQINNMCDGLILDGTDDWRMPTMPELLSVVNFEINNTPASTPVKLNGQFNALYPPSYWHLPAFFYSSTKLNPPFNGYVSNNVGYLQPGSPMGIDTWGLTGMRVIAPNPTNPMSLSYGDKRSGQTHCLRRSFSWPATLPNPRFAITDNGQVVHDNWTYRDWYRIKNYKVSTWKAGKAWCNSLNVGGKTGWNLPSMHQLLQIVDFAKKAPPYWDTDLFPQVDAPKQGAMSGEGFVTTTQLCNLLEIDGQPYCVYALNPYDLVINSHDFVSAMCIR